MAIDNNNPLEQENNPDRNGSNGEANTLVRAAVKNRAVMAKAVIRKLIILEPLNRPVQKPAAVGKKIKPWRPKHLVTQQRLILI